MYKQAMRFKCPMCGAYTLARVLDTRIEYNGISRRRYCEYCDRTFYTKEKIDHISRRPVEVRKE